MELTKKDLKHIDEEVEKLSRRIRIEATEYARLYELTYLERLKEEIDMLISTKQFIADRTIECANKSETDV